MIKELSNKKHKTIEINPTYDPMCKDTPNIHSFCFSTHWKYKNVHQSSSPKHHNTITKISPQHHWDVTKESPTRSRDITNANQTKHRNTITKFHQNITETHPRNHQGPLKSATIWLAQPQKTTHHQRVRKHLRDITETFMKHTHKTSPRN